MLGGPIMAVQEVISYPGSTSAMAGTSGSSGMRVLEVTATGLIWSARTLGSEPGRFVEEKIDTASEQIGQRRAGPLVWNVDHLHAGHAVHHLAREVQRRAESGRCVGVLRGSFLKAASNSLRSEKTRSFLAVRIFGNCHMPVMKVKSPRGS